MISDSLWSNGEGKKSGKMCKRGVISKLNNKTTHLQSQLSLQKYLLINSQSLAPDHLDECSIYRKMEEVLS